MNLDLCIRSLSVAVDSMHQNESYDFKQQLLVIAKWQERQLPNDKAKYGDKNKKLPRNFVSFECVF